MFWVNFAVVSLFRNFRRLPSQSDRPIKALENPGPLAFTQIEEEPKRSSAGRLRVGADKVLVASKARFRMGDGPNDAGLSRFHLIEACEASLKRLGTDHIDLYQLHEWDGQTPLEETLEALYSLVRSGKVRYVGLSNFSGWHLMKTLCVSEREKRVRPVSQRDPLHFAGTRGRI